MIEFLNTMMISSYTDSMNYYEIFVYLVIVFVSFVFLAPIVELQEWSSGALVTSSRIEIGIDVQIRTWSMDGPIPLDIFRRPVVSVLSKMLWCTRCKRRRDHLDNAFGKQVLR